MKEAPEVKRSCCRHHSSTSHISCDRVTLTPCVSSLTYLLSFIFSSVLRPLFVSFSSWSCSSKCALSETNQFFNIAQSHTGTCILLSHVPQSVINLKQYQPLLMKNKPMVIHSFISLQNPSLIPPTTSTSPGVMVVVRWRWAAF